MSVVSLDACSVLRAPLKPGNSRQDKPGILWRTLEGLQRRANDVPEMSVTWRFPTFLIATLIVGGLPFLHR